LSDNPKASLLEAQKLAQRALDLDDTIREVHFVLANFYSASGQLDKAIAAARRAISLDPNYADAYGVLAFSLNYAGKPHDAQAAIKKAMQLNPRYGYFYVLLVGQSYYLLGRYEEAAKHFERARTSNPDFTLVHKMLAATYVALGRMDDAEWAAQELLTLIPKFSLKVEATSSPYKDEAVFNLYIDRLRKAGLQ
jgi:adenylate cyclase